MSVLLHLFHCTYDAIFSTLPFRYRWQLLAFQPLSLLADLMNLLPNIFSKSYVTIRIPTRRPGYSVRALVFKSPLRRPQDQPTKRPLHLDFHGGAFLGGIAEYDVEFCALLAKETGAVVVSSEYNLAPRHPFPQAHDDADDVVQYLLERAEAKWGADPQLMTVSGFSAGANLALAVSQQPSLQPPSLTALKGSVTFCTPVDLRLSPGQKPRPPGFPSHDPLSFFYPLFDSYASPQRPTHLQNPRLNPITAKTSTLPRHMLFMIAGIDILLHEQLTFIERLREEVGHAEAEAGASGAGVRGRRIESMLFPGQFHGWLQLPSLLIDTETRTRALDSAVEFIRTIHTENGWVQ